MAKTDKIESKDQKVEKTTKKVNKSSYSKKKKTKKNILNGIAYVQSTFNNTIISIADTNGNVVSWASAGQKGFKGSRKSSLMSCIHTFSTFTHSITFDSFSNYYCWTSNISRSLIISSKNFMWVMTTSI